MVDVVANHVGYINTTEGWKNDNFSMITPFNQSEHYHKNCSDMSDEWHMEHCRLYNLPDLSQENPYVRKALKDWIKNLFNTYKFDGMRIDTVQYVPRDFWKEF